MRRAALLAGALAAAACSPDPPQSCPGEAVLDATFDGSRVEGAIAGDRWPTLPSCPDALLYPDHLPPFRATLAAGDGNAAALCRSGVVLFGTRSDAHWDVGTSSPGAVLAACGQNCTATSRVVVAGDVLPDPEHATSFVGALVEQLTADAGSGCAACELPCAARYALTGNGGPP